jgi:restriction endonuclease S subunit
MTDVKINKRCFAVFTNEINGRLDPLFYAFGINFLSGKFSFELRALGSLTEYIKSGFAAGSKNQADESGVLQIRPTNIGEDRLLKFDKNIFIKADSVKPDNYLQKNEVIFNNTNSQELVGKTAFFNLNEKCCCSNHITRIKVKENIILPEYLCFILNYYQEHKLFFNICTNWNNQSGVNVELLKTIKIPTPAIEIQDKIVKLIEKAFKQKVEKEKEAEEILNSIDDYVLGELGIKLSDTKDKKCFAINSDELVSKRLDPKGYTDTPRQILKSLNKTKFNVKELSVLIDKSIAGEWGEDVLKINNKEDYILAKVLRNTNFENKNNLSFDDVAERYIDKEKFEKVKLLKGDILIEKSGGSPTQPVGRVALIEDIEGDFSFSNFLQCLRLKKECLPDYLFAFLKSLYSLNYMEYIQNQTTGIKNLITEEFLAIPVPLPPIEKQKEIAKGYRDQIKKAKRLQIEANSIIEEAKNKVEKMILENNY